MKKLSVLLCALLILISAVSAFTVPSVAFSTSDDPDSKVVDDAGLLSASEEAELEAQALALVSKYDMDVVIVITDSLGYKTATEYADDYFDAHGFGAGPRNSGVLLLISMEDRDWAISTCGDAINALTDYGLDLLFNSISAELSVGNYYEAFDTYLCELDTYFQAYANGDPIDKEATAADLIPVVLIGLVLGLLIAAITVWTMTRQMNTARPQLSAGSYVTPGSFDLTVQRDTYLYSKTSRVRRAETSSGGSSTHRSSSGQRHGGSSGKF